MLRTSQNGLKLIEAFEGLETKAYLCPAGVPTIGIGHTSAAGGAYVLKNGKPVSKVALGQEITEDEARKLFSADIDRFEDKVERLVAKAKVAPTPYEFDALVSLAYNIGTGAFGGSTVLRKFNAGDKAGAADAMLAWNKATVKGKKVVVKGLVRRREAERWYFLGDFELAAKIAQTQFGAMPRSVDKPVMRETMPKSATGNTALVTGGAGALAAYSGVKEIIATGQDVKATALQAGEFLLGAGGSPWAAVAGLGVIVTLGAGVIWWRRYQRAKDDEVVEADPGELLTATTNWDNAA